MNITRLNIFPGFHLRGKIVAAYQQHVDYRREAALRMWLAFIATFAFLRVLTLRIRYPVGTAASVAGDDFWHRRRAGHRRIRPLAQPQGPVLVA